MSDDKNIPEENLKEQIQNSNEESASENIQQEQTPAQSENTNPKSEIQKSEIENMEVHHHPHHVMHKKKFAEYLVEFLMLFLAVFLGFVAENLREKSADRNKEKEYMHSMTSDLQSDITDMNRVIKSLIYVINGHDSLEVMLDNVSNKNDYEFYRKLYYANTVFTWSDISVEFTESTISELKSSGNLRLIQSKALTDSILKYEDAKKNGEDQHDYIKESISKTYFFATDIFDISYYKNYNDFLNGSNYQNKIFIPYDNVKQYISEKPQLLTNDKMIIKKYNRLVNNEKDQMALYLFYVEDTKREAMKLLQQIKTQYNFQ